MKNLKKILMTQRGCPKIRTASFLLDILQKQGIINLKNGVVFSTKN
jgi:hypothetical protein